MKGDFSRSSFNPAKRYTGVRMQQGRVQLDSDWNEQADILRHTIAALARDLVGAGAAPDSSAGFAVGAALRRSTPDGPELPDLTIGAGCYYVDGLRCDNDARLWYSEQPGAAGAPLPAVVAESSRILVYLDAWERLVTALEDPELREPALGGPDTAARTKTIWRVRLLPLAGQAAEQPGEPGWAREWQAFLESGACKGRLAVRFADSSGALGNQLYRVEIHGADRDAASFKWSRENGAVAFPIAAVDFLNPEDDEQGERDQPKGNLAVACSLLERDRVALVAGDLVELEDDLTAVGAARSLLGRVVGVRLEPGADDQIGMVVGRVTLLVDPNDLAELRRRWSNLPPDDGETTESRRLARLNRLLRRWDQDGPAETVSEAKPQPIAHDGDTWYPLERGLAIRFEGPYAYTPGDYWQIAARADAQPIELPARPPDGIAHHYAPIGLLARRGGAWHAEDLRRCYPSLPRLGDELDGERRRMDAAADELKRMRAQLDEVAYLLRRVEDVRERLHYDYRSDEPLELGEVVAIDPAREGYIVKAGRANETLVIGAVGEILADLAPPIYRVVVYGRVRCKVAGEVAPGDVLTPAALPGRAQKAGLFVRPGTLIGKALRARAPEADQADNLVDVLIALG